MFETYFEVRSWLESFIPLVWGKEELGLRRIENLLEKLGNPQKKFKSILVAGTSGKGSTTFYIARLLQCVSVSVRSVNWYSGKFVNQYVSTDDTDGADSPKIGLHVSPHLVDIRERMQIFSSSVIPVSGTRPESLPKNDSGYGQNDSNLMPMSRFVGLVNEVKAVVDDIIAKQPQQTPSYFEILVAMSFLYFAQEKVDWAVVEVGLGGRLDATNILQSRIAVITNVGLDHTEILGDTIEKIAWEKAGIIKKVSKEKVKSEKFGRMGKLGSVRVVSVVTGVTGKALKVIEKVAKEKKASLITLNTRWSVKMPKSDVFGYIKRYYYLLRTSDPSFASQNKNLALLTVLSFGLVPDAHSVKKAFSAGFPGRFEEIESCVILDGAHNVDKMMALIHFVKNSKQIQKSEIYNLKSITLVVAFKKGKDWKKMLDILVKKLPVSKVIATEYQSVTDTGKGSAVPAVEIAEYVSSAKFQIPIIKTIKNSQDAVFRALNEGAGDEIVLITGSLYLVGEARTLWKLPEF